MSDADSLMSDDGTDGTPAPLLGEDGVIHCLTQCGFRQKAQRQGWIDEGMQTMRDICSFRTQEIYELGAGLQKLGVNRGGSRQGRAQLRKLEALVRWCIERKAAGESLDAREFTEDVMDAFVEKIRLEKDAYDADEDRSVQPIKFKP